MKFGIRKFSINKRFSARTSIRRKAVHGLGIKMPRGWGWLRSPKRFIYNKIYRILTVDLAKLLKF
ncbi:hypothetical protein [Halobacteriovorax sp. DPLXC-1]|uniref:hypothetical protein n=1 Tax=Halobacteriovorax sp. DPLXC-1 TaxID=3110771 RepID=UPI002FF11A3D